MRPFHLFWSRMSYGRNLGIPTSRANRSRHSQNTLLHHRIRKYTKKPPSKRGRLDENIKVRLLATTEHQSSTAEHSQSDRGRLRNCTSSGDVKRNSTRQCSGRSGRCSSSTEGHSERVGVTPIPVTSVPSEMEGDFTSHSIQGGGTSREEPSSQDGGTGANQFTGAGCILNGCASSSSCTVNSYRRSTNVGQCDGALTKCAYRNQSAEYG